MDNKEAITELKDFMDSSAGAWLINKERIAVEHAITILERVEKVEQKLDELSVSAKRYAEDRRMPPQPWTGWFSIFANFLRTGEEW